MSGAAPPPLREALAAAGLFADKRLGQHFLLDRNLCAKIAALADLAAGETVLEVGPGPGGLTRALLEGGHPVVAIERDRRFAAVLEPLATDFEGRLTLCFADALAVEEAALAPEGAAIVANLPYNVASPLLVKWLTGAFRPSSMTLMFQKEVAERIAAPPGSRAYGRLSVLAQSLCAVRSVLDVPARAFTPPPKVDSAVIRLAFRADGPGPALTAALIAVAKAAFGQRRKMLRASLASLGGEAFARAGGVNPTARAEDLSVADFLRLAECLPGRGAQPSA